MGRRRHSNRTGSLGFTAAPLTPTAEMVLEATVPVWFAEGSAASLLGMWWVSD